MGKGNCLLGMATMGVRAVRGLMGCLCCLILIGPLLILIGLVMLFGSNSYAANVKKWNADVANYTAVTAPILLKTKVEFPNNYTNVPQIQKNIQPSGNTKDVTGTATSYYFETSTNYNLTYAMTATIDSTGFAPAGASIADSIATIQVGGSDFTTPTSRTVTATCNDDGGCSYSKMRSKCASNAPSTHNCDEGDMTVQSSRNNIRRNDRISCTYYTYTPYFCRPMSLQASPKKWVGAPGMSSCDYPFTSQVYKCSSTSHSAQVPVRFMASNDPHIELSRITKGKMNFGLTELQQRLTGVACIVVGSLFIGAMVAMCICMRDAFCGNKHEHRAAVYGAFGRQYSYPQGYQPVVYQQPAQIQGAYAQPDPAYGQAAPPGYGQQPQQQGGYQQPLNQQGGYPAAQGGYPAAGGPPPPGGYDQYGKQSAPMPGTV